MCLFLCNFVGVMLYELLALEPPFVKSSLSDLVKSILDDECPDIPAHYSSELKYVVYSMLIFSWLLMLSTL